MNKPNRNPRIRRCIVGAIAAAGLAGPATAQHEDHDEHTAFPPQGVLLPDLTPGFVLIEGDIQIRLDQYLILLTGGEATFGGTSWLNATVPFTFNANVTPSNQALMLSAMAQISQRAGVTFRPVQGGDLFWIHIQNSTGNSSAVGMVAPGQTLNIASWNDPFIIIHELYHALGYWHEHSRPDRNVFISINAQNISSPGGGANPDFILLPLAGTYGAYDFDSIMHYPRCAFANACLPSSNCNCTPAQETITVNAPWNAQWQNVIGQRDHFSYYDGIMVRAGYPFAGDRWWTPSSILSLGTFMQPYNVHPSSAVLATPAGGTLFLKHAGMYSGTGLYTSTGPVTIDAPEGPVTLGN